MKWLSKSTNALIEVTTEQDLYGLPQLTTILPDGTDYKQDSKDFTVFPCLHIQKLLHFQIGTELIIGTDYKQDSKDFTVFPILHIQELLHFQIDTELVIGAFRTPAVAHPVFIWISFRRP